MHHDGLAGRQASLLLEQAVRAKLEVNAGKYPVSKSRGSIRKYNEPDQ